MKNLIIILILLFTASFLQAQDTITFPKKNTIRYKDLDSLDCDQIRAYFNRLYENVQSIILWDSAPVLKEDSKKYIKAINKFVREETKYAHIYVFFIINSKGIPTCFEFGESIEEEIKNKLLNKVKLLRFYPATARGEGRVATMFFKIPIDTTYLYIR